MLAGEAMRAWGKLHGRKPAWRDSSDRYPLVVAEILLQKTKAADALPVWTSVLLRFPSADVLARADLNELRGMVHRLGLGSQRASRLRTAAAAIVNEDERITGLGPYGTGVLDLVDGRMPRKPPIDGNVARVLTRWRGFAFARGEPRKKRELAAFLADLLVAASTPDQALSLLYALVDLGATVCTPSKPSCPECPLLSSCVLAESSRCSTARSPVASAAASGGGTESET